MNLQIERQVHLKLTENEERSLTWLDRALQAAAEVEKVSGSVSVQIVDNQTIRQLNRTYRRVDRSTDVLSFPQWETDEEMIMLSDEPIPLGDIVISMQKAKQQAAEYGHSLERELGFLAVHGFLHLLGYDHQNREQEKEMFAKQEAILQWIGLQR